MPEMKPTISHHESIALAGAVLCASIGPNEETTAALVQHEITAMTNRADFTMADIAQVLVDLAMIAAPLAGLAFRAVDELSEEQLDRAVPSEHAREDVLRIVALAQQKSADRG